MHVNLHHYVLALRRVLPSELLLQQAHRHLMSLCSTCRREWDGREAFRSNRPEAPAPSAADFAARRPPDERDFSIAHYDEEQGRQSRMRAIARRAREDLARLRQLPHRDWPEVVHKARTRFRSRAFILLLLEECRAVVRSAPREAAALAALVPVAVGKLQDHESLSWARELMIRAAAHHGNALRVAGDLSAADRVFGALRRQLDHPPLHESNARAEIASFEASLRIDQRRFTEAERLLVEAAARGSHGMAGRILVKHANLQMTLGRVEQALAQFERAAAVLDASAEPLLHLATVTGRVDCLCELDRAADGAQLLKAERSAYLSSGDSHLAALYAFYRARVALGLGRHADAEAGFTAARQQFLDLDRDYDAILASLYLADTLLAARKTTELRKLAADLVPLFRSRGVERETLASLRLLAEAAKAETLTAALLTELRRSLDGRTRAEPRGAGDSDS